jgi:assimilatory nitrate reductase catalytic subunit
MTAIKTTCAYCGVGCGMLATPQADGSIKIAGDPEHPANFGRLCSKGSALGETLGLKGRLLSPHVRGTPTGWEEAVGLAAAKFSEAIRDHGPDSVAFYVSGQLLTEDYYVANKLMKGFIGSANIDTNSRLCMASAVAGHTRAFGADVVCGNYEDFEEADLVVLVGSNLAWCHPVLFQRLMTAREQRGTVLAVIDVRRTVTADAADLFLQIKPGTDVALFDGLLCSLHRRGNLDRRYVLKHTDGLAEALTAAAPWNIDAVAATTGVAPHLIGRFYDVFASTAKTVTAFSMGVNQSSAGTDKVNAIINCHLLTGRVGKRGASPFSITGQPNAMGGREVGGLATMLAAHMEIGNAAHRDIVRNFWRAPTMAAQPGLKAVDLFTAVRAGRIRALWIMATNPAVSMPDSDSIAEALSRCPFVAVSDVTAETETARHADVLLPAAAWGEKNGTVTNSERRISRQRSFLVPAGESRPDWQIICSVARAMGFSGFDFASPAEIFREYAALTGAGNNGTRSLDLSRFAGISDADYDRLDPWQWGGARCFGDGKFRTASGRAHFVATPFRPPASAISNAFPMVMNTGRIRDQWHTMTRTGLSPRLFAHQAEPFAEIHRSDAQRLGLAEAGLALVEASGARAILRVLTTDRVARGEIFLPMHWSATFAGEAKANRLSRGHADPVSGQPELKFAPVRVRKYDAQWYGFGVSVRRPAAGPAYWAVAPIAQGFRFECADSTAPPDWRSVLGAGPDAEVSTYRDRTSGALRCAIHEEGRLTGAFYVSREPIEAARSWVCDQLNSAGRNRLEILAGRPADPTADHGAIVCACMHVGARRIAAEVRSRAGCTMEDIGLATTAGTGCGACRPEIARIIHDNMRFASAAE